MKNSNVPSGKEPVFCLLDSFLNFGIFKNGTCFEVQINK